MNKSSVKSFFGKMFREARESKKFSRAALALRLGVSPKTIQSWEMGRTFIENLNLIPEIEKELDVAFTDLISKKALQQEIAAEEAAPVYGSEPSYSAFVTDKAAAGPQRPVFVVYADDKSVISENDYMAVPLIRPESAAKNICEISKKDIIKHCLFPFDWSTRGRIFVSFTMSDSSLEPEISHGSDVLIDIRISDAERVIDKFAAIWFPDKGLRIRKIGKYGKKYFGASLESGKRANIYLNPEKGDRIIGKVVGWMSKHS
ncbi:MAG: helix-turn-helix domain-containing protein [Planctomycetota bacterium]|jgi:transcriptional regulator with XRE-family HTH domain